VPGMARVLQYRGAGEAWAGTAAPRTAWLLQTEVLAKNLGMVPFTHTSIIGFANYVLGFGHIRSDLDLQQATSLATTFKQLQPSQVRVCAAPVLVQRCRGGRAWRVDPAAAAGLRRTLAAGSLPAPSRPLLTRTTSRARVLVVLPGRRWAAREYVERVRAALAASAGAPVAVKAVTVSDWPRLAARTMAAARRWEPLAVLVAPPAAVAQEEVADADSALRVLGAALRLNWLPAVVSEPLSAESTATATPEEAALRAAVYALPQPVSPLPAAPARSGAVKQAALAARANVATLVRACWSSVLAPGLVSTREGFSFGARRRTVVGVAAPSVATAERYLDRLRTWGFRVRLLTSVDGLPQLTGTAVLYRPGLRRAALALAGDLGLALTAVAADAGSPAPLTLIVR
jgi:hypothetical protein